MSFFNKICRAFQQLDTSEAEAAITAALRSQRDIAVRARALRMDICCDAPHHAIVKLMTRVCTHAQYLLDIIYHDGNIAAPTPDTCKFSDEHI